MSMSRSDHLRRLSRRFPRDLVQATFGWEAITGGTGLTMFGCPAATRTIPDDGARAIGRMTRMATIGLKGAGVSGSLINNERGRLESAPIFMRPVALADIGDGTPFGCNGLAARSHARRPRGMLVCHWEPSFRWRGLRCFQSPLGPASWAPWSSMPREHLFGDL